MNTREVTIEIMANYVMQQNTTSYMMNHLPTVSQDEKPVPFSQYRSNESDVIDQISDLIEGVVEKVKEIQK